jgi:hypothetical protein
MTIPEDHPEALFLVDLPFGWEYTHLYGCRVKVTASTESGEYKWQEIT